MDFFQVIDGRRSMRKYANRPVEEEKLVRILESASKAPSAGNLQGYEIYLVRKNSDRQGLVKAALDQEFFGEAPIVLVFCSDAARSAVQYGDRGANLYSIQDATIACAYAQLAARAQDLDSVWVGAFDEDAVRTLLKIPDTLRPVVLLPIGYAGKVPVPRPRRTLKDLVHEVK